MSSDIISRIQRERLVDRSAVRCKTGWVYTETEGSPETGTPGVFSRAAQSPKAADTMSSPVLVMLRPDHIQVVEEMIACAEAGSRVYVLVSTQWDEKHLPQRLRACRSVLIRRIPEVPVIGIHRAEQTTIWMGSSPSRPAPWCLFLDPVQADSFRQLFVSLFWQQAEDEAWTGGKSLVFRPPGTAPFDIPTPTGAAPLQLHPAGTQPTSVDPRALIHNPAGVIPQGTPRRVLIPPTGSGHSQLEQLFRAGTEIEWEERDLPFVLIEAAHASIWLSSPQRTLSITLNEAQKQTISRILDSHTSWIFGIDLSLAEWVSRDRVSIWLPNRQKAEPITREELISLPAVQAKELPNAQRTEPSHFPEPHPLALTVRYKWTVLPPVVPSAAAEDPLVGSWRKLDEEWQRRCKKQTESIDDASGHQSQLGKLFARLASALLGFGHSSRSLKEELSALQEKRPSIAGPMEAPALFESLAALEQRIGELRQRQEDAEQKAKEDQAREEQRQQWEQRQKDASSSLSNLQQQLAQNNQQLAELNQLSQEIAQKQASLDAEPKAEESKGTTSTEPTSTEESPKKKDSGKDKRKERDKGEVRENDQAHAELRTQQLRNADDLKKAERERSKLVAEIERCNEQLAEEFVFHPPEKPASRTGRGTGVALFTNTPKQASPTGSLIPNEALPEVGMLRSHKGQRYLVIEQWSELAAAQQAAARLSAGLVTTEKQ